MLGKLRSNQQYVTVDGNGDFHTSILETAIGCVLVLASLPSLGERFCGTLVCKATEKNRR